MPEDLFKEDKKNFKSSKFSYFSVLFVLFLLVSASVFVYQMIYNADKLALKEREVKEFDYLQFNRSKTQNGYGNETHNSKSLRVFFIGADKGSTYFPTLGYYDSASKKLNKVSKFDKSSIIEFGPFGSAAVALVLRQEDVQGAKSIYAASRFFYDLDFTKDYSFKNAREIRVPNNKPYYIRNLSVCGDNLFFAGTKNLGNGKLPPFEKWHIYKLNLKDGKLNEIAKGAEPICLNENLLTYLSVDGLRVYSLSEDRSELIRKLSKIPDYQFLSLSGDKKILLWSFPKQKRARIFQFLSYKPVILRDVKTIENVTVLNPVLSNSGKYALYLHTSNLKTFRKNFDRAEIRKLNLEKGMSEKFNFPIDLFDLRSFRLLNLQAR